LCIATSWAQTIQNSWERAHEEYCWTIKAISGHDDDQGRTQKGGGGGVLVVVRCKALAFRATRWQGHNKHNTHVGYHTLAFSRP